MFRLFFLCLLASSALSKSPSVIIIGAGPSGIAAAVRLIENSVTNITILEAENRIGGRIYTTDFGDGVVDVGAEYCDGEEGNTVYQTVKNLNLLERSHVINPETNKLYYSNGSRIPHDLGYELDSTITNYKSKIQGVNGVPLGDAFTKLYNTTILEKYKENKDSLKIMTDGLKFAQDLILFFEGSFNWQTPASGKHYTACKGDQMTWKTGGFQSFLNVLLKKYPDPDEAIPIESYTILNNRVEKIIWNGDKVTVKSSNNRSLDGDYVIFTPSLGVLQAEKDTLFKPALPRSKIETIDALGFGAIMKIILHFPEKWWRSEDKVFYFVWSSEDLVKVKDEFFEGPSGEGLPWITRIVAFVVVPSQPNVLIAWVSGNLIPEIEQTSEDIIRKGVIYVSQKFLGKDYNVTAPDEVMWSHWYTNPSFRGSLSYEKADYYTKDISYHERLGEPLINRDGNPVVLFAGEATNPTMYSSVHGAVDSGRREADRILSLMKG